MADPILVPGPAVDPSVWVLLSVGGIAWGALVGRLADRPGSGVPVWWPVQGAIGLSIFGLVGWVAFGGVLVAAVRVMGGRPDVLATTLLAVGWLVVLTAMSAFGRGRDAGIRAHLAAGFALIAFTLGVYFLIGWYVENFFRSYFW